MKLSKEQLVQRMKSEITADVLKRRVPTTVKSFSELHDYVDANCYGGLCDPEADFDTSDQAQMDIANAAQTEVSQWLARGGLFDAALTLANGDRLAAFASLGVKQVESPIPAPKTELYKVWAHIECLECHAAEPGEEYAEFEEAAEPEELGSFSTLEAAQEFVSNLPTDATIAPQTKALTKARAFLRDSEQSQGFDSGEAIEVIRELAAEIEGMSGYWTEGTANAMQRAEQVAGPLQCKHNTMIRTDNKSYVWKCADCGYVYGDEKLTDIEEGR